MTQAGRSPFPPIPASLANFAAWRRAAALAEALRAADSEPPATAIASLHAAATRAERDIAALAQRLPAGGRVPRRKARKPFLCSVCGTPIPRGTHYLDYKTRREHLQCAARQPAAAALGQAQHHPNASPEPS